MRPSRMLLIAVLAVLTSLTTAASPALAQSQPPSVQACDSAVCLSVTVDSATALYIQAWAHLPAPTCGHFEATVRNPSYVIRATSATVCLAGPTWYSGVMVPSTHSVTVTVRFISDPPTLGEPSVRL